MDKDQRREAIIDLLLNKAALKQDIADYSEGVFESFKVVVQDELKQIKEAVDWAMIETKRHPVYIHCAHGHGRSIAVLISCLIKSGVDKSSPSQMTKVCPAACG